MDLGRQEWRDGILWMGVLRERRTYFQELLERRKMCLRFLSVLL